MEETNNKPIKVLQINAGSKNYGGVSAMVFEIYKNIDKEKFQFDFVSPMKTTYEIKRDQIEKMGGNIIELNTNGNLIKRKIQLYFRLKRLIKEKKYQIIHINSGSFFFNLNVAIIAKKMKIKKIIVHSHNGINPNEKLKNGLTKIFKPLLPLFATDFLTCSIKAAENMYTKRMIEKNRIITIPNGIETEKFKYNDEIRKQYRDSLKLEDKIVIGNVGRFMEQKNHKFLIAVFNEFLKINNNAILLLIGEGELQEETKKQVKELHIEEYVKFLGLRKDIPELLCAMDVFVMTSFHEGLPVVGVEAQTSGLPLVLSDYITREVDLSDNVRYIKLEEGADKWAKKINEILNCKVSRHDAYKNIKEKGFDIKETVKKIEKIYLS